jgi:hypothetical protein
MTGPVIGYAPGAVEAAQKETANNYDELSKTYAAGGEPAQKMLSDVEQLRQLSNASKNADAFGQFTGAWRDKLMSIGLGNVSNAQQAQTALDAKLKTLIPELKSDYNLSRVAQPEITLLGKVTGSADMPPGVLESVLTNLEAGANLSVALRDQAGRVLRLSPGDPTNYPDYAQAADALFKGYGASADKLRTQYDVPGALPKPPVTYTSDGTTTSSPPPTSDPVSSFFGGLAHVLGWGSNASPVNAPPPVNGPPPANAPVGGGRELIPGQDF